MVKIGINGFGRIGRLVARAALATDGVEIVGVHDLIAADAMALLFKYDSIHGRLDGEVSADGDAIVVNGKKIPVLYKRDGDKVVPRSPGDIPWSDVGAEIVVESTGIFRSREAAGGHLGGSVKKVIISAPSGDADKMIVMGVNDNVYDAANHHVVSNASCTTNCLAPVVKVLHALGGLEKGLMNTIHSYTNDQNIHDSPHKDLRRARAGAVSMIPTKTGAAAAIGKVIPELDGKLDGFSIRVPTPNVSCVDLTCVLSKAVTVEQVNEAVKKASEGELKGILGYTDLPLVSIDFCTDPRSSIFDSGCTRVMDGTLVKIVSWYDNEWGYSSRTIDLAKFMAAKGL